MGNKKISIVVSLLILVFLLTAISPISSQLSIDNNPQWRITQQTGNEVNFKVIFTNIQDKKTDICLVLKDGVNPLTTNLNPIGLYDAWNFPILDDKNKAIVLKYETAKCLDGATVKNGYHISLTNVQAVNVNNFIKIGTATIILVYQNISTVTYDYGNTQVNATIERCDYNKTCGIAYPSVLIVNESKLKFGAEDTGVTANTDYRYTFTSNKPIRQNSEGYYIEVSKIDYPPVLLNLFGYSNIDMIKIDTDDICSSYSYNETLMNFTDYQVQRVYTNGTKYYVTRRNVSYYEEERFFIPSCEFVVTNNTLQIYFFSRYDKTTSKVFIDPSYNITESNIFSQSNYSGVRGEANFSHLNMTFINPFNFTVLYLPFDVNGTNTYDYSKNNYSSYGATSGYYNDTCLFGGCFGSGVSKMIRINPINTYDCSGTPSSLVCSQFTSQSPCLSYSSHTSRCSWVAESCSGFEFDCSTDPNIYDEATCLSHTACSPSYSCSGSSNVNCIDITDSALCNDYSAFGCEWNSVCDHLGYLDWCSVNANSVDCGNDGDCYWDGSSCTYQSGIDCSMDVSGANCGYITSCSALYSSCFGNGGCETLTMGQCGTEVYDGCTYSPSNCTGSLTCASQTFSDQACRNITGCTFSGNNDFDLIENYTISFWIKNLKAPFQSQSMVIAERRGAPYGQGWALFMINSTAGVQSIGFSSIRGDGIYPIGFINTKTLSYSNYNFPLNTWTHFMLIGKNQSNGMNLTMYINNVQVNSSTSANFTPSAVISYVNPTSGYLQVSSQTSNQGFNASMDELMILRTALSDANRTLLYNNQSVRFVPSGTMETNRTNVSSGMDTAVVKLTGYQMIFNTNITLAVHWWNTTSNNYTSYQKITGFNNFTIPVTTTNVSVIFNLSSDPFKFYTPNLLALGGITLNLTIIPTVTFKSQVPADITSNNIIGQGSSLNISYNVTGDVNLSSVTFYYKTNDSIDNYFVQVNGSVLFYDYTNSRNVGRTTVQTINDTVNWTWRLWDNSIYPATYNFNEPDMENTVHQTVSLGNNNIIKIRLFNVSNSSLYGFFEIMALNTTAGASPLEIYYCNSTYTNGNPSVNSNCNNFGNIPASTVWNHTHTTNSSHYVVPFLVNNVTGKIGTTKVSSSGYFLVRSNNWNIYYITNISRADSIQSSDNIGASYTNFAGTVDSHIHQYDSAQTFYYYVCAGSNSGLYNCSSVRSDLIQLGGIPPTSPSVYNPYYALWTGTIGINYTESTSANNYNISYNITLLYSDFTYYKTITTNNSNRTGYVWDTTTVPDAYYIIQVMACDTLNQCVKGYSELFGVDNIITPVSSTGGGECKYKKLGYYNVNLPWIVKGGCT